MTDHTPGPWEVRELSAAFRPLSFGIGSNGPGLVARVSSIPNARLIAAAPELLEALETLVKCHEDVGMSGFVRPDDDVLTTAKQAIARATGEE